MIEASAPNNGKLKLPGCTLPMINGDVNPACTPIPPDNYLAASPTWAAVSGQTANFRLMDPAVSVGPNSIASWIDYIFLIIFAVEMTIKMLASGLVLHPNSYLRNTWNWLDFLVVTIGFIDM